MKILSLCLMFALLLSLLPSGQVSAQESGAYYILREGEKLEDVARYFHTTIRALSVRNYIGDDTPVLPGKRIYIPDLDDLEGQIIQTNLPAGETTHNLSRLLREDVEVLTRLNHLTTTGNQFEGIAFYQLKQEEIEQTRMSLTAGISEVEFAVTTGSNPWLAALYNDLRGPWALVRNDVIFLPGTITASSDLFPTLETAEVYPSPVKQGKTTMIKAIARDGAIVGGSLLGYPLHFFPGNDGRLTALQGIPRMANPGLVPMTLTTTTADGRVFTHQQNLLLRYHDYGFDTPISVADNVVDPAITEPEFNLLMELTRDAPAENFWTLKFAVPVPAPIQITSNYGRLRAYNDGDYSFYHTGIDYYNMMGTPILATAPGVVVYTGELTVRGKATIISHGRGVYSGYWHQEQINVSVGDLVKPGQTIGLMGATGRVNGPHLHFDMIVGGVEVDPADWLKGLYIDV